MCLCQQRGHRSLRRLQRLGYCAGRCATSLGACSLSLGDRGARSWGRSLGCCYCKWYAFSPVWVSLWSCINICVESLGDDAHKQSSGVARFFQVRRVSVIGMVSE